MCFYHGIQPSKHLSDLALKWNRNDQAQQYYIPALMLLLGRRGEKDAYVNDTISTYDPEANEIAAAYKAYIRELDDLICEEHRKPG